MNRLVSFRIEGGDVRARITPGLPGTAGGLRLRLAQFAISVATICIAATSKDVYDITAVRFLLAASTIQCAWSIAMAIVDARSLLAGHLFNDMRLLKSILIGDAIIVSLVGYGALGVMGIIIMLVNDEKQSCGYSSCNQMLFAFASALASSTLAATSYLADMIVLNELIQAAGDTNMITVIGRPYSMSGLVLRVLQLLFATASSYLMFNSKGHSLFTCFMALIIVMLLISLWSFLMIFVDSYGLWKQWINDGSSTPVFHLVDLVGWFAAVFVVGTCWAIIVFYLHDRHLCHDAYPCGHFLISLTSAGIAWLSLTISASVNLWIFVKYL